MIKMFESFSVKGFKVFNELVNFTFRANKKFKNKDYVFNYQDKEILKSAIMYGPNNTGKSAFIESIKLLKSLILNGKITDKNPFYLDYNYFSPTKQIDYAIEFIQNNNYYKYLLSFTYSDGIINEILYCNNFLIFDRNKTNENNELNDAIKLFNSYHDMLLISTLPKDFKYHTDNVKNFFNSITIISGYIDFNDVINMVSNLSTNELNKFNKVINAADISIKDVTIKEVNNEDDNLLRLYSEYVMNKTTMSMPSFISDSDGTKTFMYYILKIIETMRSGGVIVIDEIDKSLHTLLSKNIISVINDEKNNNIQLLATSHDLLLLDCLYLFRKDQVWLTYKDDQKVYLYSLDEYKSNIDKCIRNKTMESYLSGMLGSLPHPNIEDFIFDD